MHSVLEIFPKNLFPMPFLAAFLNFCIKCKKAFISETVRDRAISTKFLTHRVSAEFTGNFSQKIFFPPFLVAILNFCIKHKTFILEIVHDRAILTKFLTRRVYTESTLDFLQKSLSCHFAGHLEFLCKIHFSWKQ